MTSVYIVLAAGAAMIGMICLFYFQGKSAGAAATQNDTLKEIDSVQDKQAAILVQPRTAADTADRLHNGSF